MMTPQLLGGIEAGGTKFICALADCDGAVLEQARIATGDPDATFAQIASFFAAHSATYGPIGVGGVASFGPLDLDPGSARFGSLTTTPKAGWAGIDMLGRIRQIMQAPVAIDTDVNCAALAEMKFGVGRGLTSICYMTIGTGIGVGIAGLHGGSGTGHAEVGHIRIARALGDDFAGVCTSHGDCAEGLASGPAMYARWQQSAENLPDDHIGWRYAAHYIAQICVNLTYTLRPQRIVLGGGLMERAPLIQAVRDSYLRLSAGYALDRYSSDAMAYLCAPQLRDPSPGLVGAVELARRSAASGMTERPVT